MPEKRVIPNFLNMYIMRMRVNLRTHDVHARRKKITAAA
jgi:hypothetical protein